MNTSIRLTDASTSDRAEALSDALSRRGFLQRSLAVAGRCALCFGGDPAFAASPVRGATGLVSPGCRRTKVKVAKLYLGVPKAHWPTPKLDLEAERKSYEADFTRLGKEFADVEFVVNQFISRKEELNDINEKLREADAVFVIHLSMGVEATLREILAYKKPTVLFAAPYSGHEWSRFGALRAEPTGEYLECMLTGDRRQLAAAIRPFRAIHHLREAKILNLTTRPLAAEKAKAIADKVVFTERGGVEDQPQHPETARVLRLVPLYPHTAGLRARLCQWPC